MKKIVKISIIVLAVLVLLAITRPSENNFKNWVKKEYSVKSKSSKPDNILDNLAEKGIAKATEIQILSSYQYKSYFLASEVVSWANIEKKRYLGILGLWVPLPAKE